MQESIRRTIRRQEVLKKTGLSRTQQFNLERAGDFPKHFMLTPRLAVWVEEEVEHWLRQRRDAAVKSTSMGAVLAAAANAREGRRTADTAGAP